MALNKKIKRRMADSLASSYYKSWFKRWWGKALLVLVIITIIAIIYFIGLVTTHYSHTNKGDVYNDVTGEWISPEEFIANRKVVGELLAEDDPWLGDEEPLIYIVSYDSFGCPFCKEAEGDIRKILEEFGSVVRFIAKDFPTEGTHPGVFDAHLAAGCANEQNAYWEYRDILYERQADFKEYDLKEWADELGLNQAQFRKCFDEGTYNSEIRQDYANGVQAGIVGTPSYMVNGTLIPGRVPYETWKQVLTYLIQQEL
ncbi:DsbA family protein [Candidatus Parcubacteria bacterium]|nr:DsbA family protein [Candidatus Parcubacteria bacterium]